MTKRDAREEINVKRKSKTEERKECRQKRRKIEERRGKKVEENCRMRGRRRRRKLKIDGELRKTEEN